MDAYRCAYRDPKSPLTPLTPMSTNVFDFNKITPKARTKSPSGLVPTLKLKSPAVCRSKPQHLLSVNYKPSEYYKLTPVSTSKKLTPVLTSKKLTPGSSVSNSKITLTKKIKYIQYSSGGKVVTKYQSYVVKETSQMKAVINKYHLSPCYCSQPNSTSTKKTTTFRAPISPVVPKKLCAQVAQILMNTGMEKYLELFQNEEIDSAVFRSMTEDDLIEIGIQSQLDRDIILNAARYWTEFY